MQGNKKKHQMNRMPTNGIHCSASIGLMNGNVSHKSSVRFQNIMCLSKDNVPNRMIQDYCNSLSKCIKCATSILHE